MGIIITGAMKKAGGMRVATIVEVPEITPVTVTHIGTAINAASQTTYTFSSQNLGIEAANRKIVIAVYSAGFPPPLTLNSVTVAGNSANKVIDVVDTVTVDQISALWQVELPTGTSGDIVVTFSGSMSICGIGVYAVFGAAISANDTGSSIVNPLTDTLNIPANGVAIGTSGNVIVGAASSTWTNLTEDYDQLIEVNVTHSGASDEFALEQIALPITDTLSSNPTIETMVIASWGPA